MSLTSEQVRKVASLARLELSDAELSDLGAKLGQTLDYVARLNELDTDGVEPLVHAIELSNVLRPDVLTPSLPRDRGLANAPRTDGKHFLVPAILEG